MASRCSTALVEPPVAATEAMAFSKAARVQMASGRTSFLTASRITRPQCAATSFLRGSACGTMAVLSGDRPISSITVAIVLAVNWPPQAPAPGEAQSSMCLNSDFEILPAANAPTASKTSWMVMSRPW